MEKSKQYAALLLRTYCALSLTCMKVKTAPDFTTQPLLSTQEQFSLSPGRTFGPEQAKLTLKFFTTTNLFTCSYLKAGFLHAPHGQQ